jgi:hypothetical protein
VSNPNRISLQDKRGEKTNTTLRESVFIILVLNVPLFQNVTPSHEQIRRKF